jgi:hypothetical protein
MVEIIEITEPRKTCERCGASNYPGQGKTLCDKFYTLEGTRLCGECYQSEIAARKRETMPRTCWDLVA